MLLMVLHQLFLFLSLIFITVQFITVSVLMVLACFDSVMEPTDWSHWLNWEFFPFLCSVFVLPVRISAAFLLSMRSTYTSLTVKVRSFFWFIDLASFYGLSSLTVSCASYFFSDFDVFPPPCSGRGTL